MPFPTSQAAHHGQGEPVGFGDTEMGRGLGSSTLLGEGGAVEDVDVVGVGTADVVGVGTADTVGCEEIEAVLLLVEVG